MTYRKKLIEVALPLEAINIASAREKSIRHGHPSTLHLWWARRPLAACRAVIFASLVDDPDDPDAPAEFVAACRELPKGKNAIDNDTPRQRLFDFIEKLVQWESTTDEEVLEKARELIRLATGGNPPPLLDPFAGGGSIPLEAQRLGLDAHASDINPVAVMINKALIEIPPRFANRPPINPRDRDATKQTVARQWKGAEGLATDVRYYGEWMRERAWERIGHLYPDMNGETVIAWLWARTVKCPNPACGAQMPLASSFELSMKKGRYVWVEPKVDRGRKIVKFDVKSGTVSKAPSPTKQGRGANFQCVVCGEIASDPYIKSEGIVGRIGTQLMAVVTGGKNGRKYNPPSTMQEKIAAEAHPSWTVTGKLPENPRWFSPPLFGMSDFADLFTPRQLVALTTFSDLVTEAREQAMRDALTAGIPDIDVPLSDGGAGARAYADAISTYLGLGVSRLSDIQNNLCMWETSKTQVRHLFTRHAIPMLWDFAENNLFNSSAGDYLVTLNSMVRVLEKLGNGLEGSAEQSDARAITKDNLPLISTDPPYYDNIGYADLSDFFYIWIRPSLKNLFPDLFKTIMVPKTSELIASTYRFDGDKRSAEEYFESGLEKTFSQLCRISSNEFPLSIFYAFKQTEGRNSLDEDSKGTLPISTGWEKMLSALMSAGLLINGTWPTRTESTNRPIASGTNALASSIVLVCRPRPKDAPITTRRDFVALLQRELPTTLKELQSGNIAPVDLAQASIGPGMAVFSRYSKVLEPNGEAMTVRTALQLINQALDEYLVEQEGDLDAETRFAVAWFEQYGWKEAEFGIADVLARAKNASVDGLVRAGVVSSGAGKVQLIPWEAMDPGWDPTTDKRPTIWEAVHHLIERLNTHGEDGAAMLLAKMPHETAAEARQLAYRLYSICERKGWAEAAREYNMLVTSWGGSQERAATYRGQYQQGRLI